MARTLALTGATGFIGSSVLRRLLADGWQVRALHRAAAPPAQPNGGGERLRWVRGSLDDPESLRRLVQDAAVVIHCAGAIRGASAEHFHRVNVDGTARLVQAAAAVHPVPRFLLISSLAARAPHLSHYAQSKRRGEDALRAGAEGMAWTVLRPPAVYGPGDRETLPLVRCMQHGFAPVLGPPGSRFSLLFVADLADAVRHLLELPTWSAQAFEIHDGRSGGYGWADMVDTVARLIRRPVRRVAVPRLLMQAAAGGNLMLSRLFGYKPMLSPGKVRELSHPDWVCDDAALRRATGWRPGFALEDGMRRTLAHLRAGRWTIAE